MFQERKEIPVPPGTLLTNCPRDCYDNCGIWVQAGKEGRVVVRGDPNHPVSRGSLCAKCTVAYNGAWQDPKARLRTPLRRVGDKGAGRFEEISWDEAFSTIAARLQTVIAEQGPEAILHTHYSGTISLLAYLFPMRFFHRLGATEVEPDSICNLSGHVAWSLLFGISVAGFDPRTARDASTIFVWGANPSHTAPHMDEHWLGEFEGHVVVIDPIRSETAARADLHLQPFPGSDAALAFAILRELGELGAFDETFIAAHVHGADDLRPSLASCTPEWGEAQSGVPAAAIRQAARLYAAGPALLWAGQGLQRQPTGANIMRAIGLLPAFTGNVGKPGAGFYYLNISPALVGADFDALAGAELAAGDVPKVNHIGLAAELERAQRFRAFIVWNTNPVASAAEQARLRRALTREDLFTVVVDCFPTDTVDYADIVLPAASFLEFDDLTFSYMNPIVGAQTRARDPIGEALPNMEIFRRLARAMGFEDDALFEEDEAIIARLLREMKVPLSFEELSRVGHRFLSEEPLNFHEALAFDTPSGKIEVASDAAVAEGLPRLPSPEADPRPARGMFRLLSPASKWRLNDSYANDATVAKRSGPASVTIHPEDAAELGLSEGISVRLSNEAGAIELRAVIAALAPRGVLLSHKGRWPKLEGSGANVNVLHVPRSSDVPGCSAVHGTEVRLEVLS